MGSWQQRYLDRFYYRRRGWIDGTTEFHELCTAVISPAQRILEVGAGPTNRTSQHLARLGDVHGLDPDPAVLDNEALKTATVMRAGTFPFPRASFDVCVSNFVIEHVASPSQHLHEVRRVLRPRGQYVFRTPNRWHFVYLVSSTTPHAVHAALANRLRALPADAHEPYPTFYAMNTPRDVRRLASAHGMRVEVLQMLEKEPSYGMVSRALFFPFLAYERTVNSSERLAGLRSIIHAVIRVT